MRAPGALPEPAAVSAAYSLIPVQSSDAPFLMGVYASTRAEELVQVDWTPEQKQAFVAMQYNAQASHYARVYPEAEYSIIQCSEAPAGRLIVQRGHTVLLLMDIALLPQFQRAGIGTAIIRDLMAEACQKGLPVVLHVENFNPARRLYERLGFHVCAEEGFYLEMEWRPEEDEHDEH